MDNISGIGKRRKTRIRWYNDDISKLVLEFKIKSNKASRKELYPLSNPNLITPNTPALLRSLTDDNRNIIPKLLSEPMMPSLEVQYMALRTIVRYPKHANSGERCITQSVALHDVCPRPLSTYALTIHTSSNHQEWIERQVDWLVYYISNRATCGLSALV